MNNYHIIIKKGNEIQENNLASEETYYALAHQLWDKVFDHKPIADETVNVGSESYMPCYILTDVGHNILLAGALKKRRMNKDTSQSEGGYITAEMALTSMLGVKVENVVAIIDESYPERQKRADEALARVLAGRTTPAGLCTYHITIKQGNQIQEYDMDSSEYYLDVAKRLWKENFSHKPTREIMDDVKQPGGYYVPRRIVDDSVNRLPAENAVMVDGDPDPMRRGAIHEAMNRAREQRIKARGMITYHVTIKRRGKVVKEYDVNSDEGASKLCKKIWNETFKDELTLEDNFAGNFINRGNRFSSHHEGARGQSVTVIKSK